jgi:hypothetical protein
VLVASTAGLLIEALGSGVTKTPASKYLDQEYHLFHLDYSSSDREQAVAFASYCADNRDRYGFLTIASIGLALLTRGKLVFGLNGTEICSGLVARSLERCGEIFSGDPSQIMPAELAQHFHYTELP